MRRTPLARKPMKARAPVRKVIDRAASEAWAKAARTKRCAVCGARIVHGHHLIYQQQLRRIAVDLGIEYERVRWDRRNLLALCDRHHSAHHSGAHRVVSTIVLAGAPKFGQFVRELDRQYEDGREPVAEFVRRTYPQADDA